MDHGSMYGNVAANTVMVKLDPLFGTDHAKWRMVYYPITGVLDMGQNTPPGQNPPSGQ